MATNTLAINCIRTVENLFSIFLVILAVPMLFRQHIANQFHSFSTGVGEGGYPSFGQPA